MTERRNLSRHYPGAIQLSYEGTLEVLDEIENGPKNTPERRATLERAAAWNDKIDRLFSSERNARRK